MASSQCVCGCSAGMHKTREGDDRGCRNCDGHAGGVTCTGFQSSSAVQPRMPVLADGGMVSPAYARQQLGLPSGKPASDLTFDDLERNLRLRVQHREGDANSPLIDMAAAVDGYPGVWFYVEGRLTDLVISRQRVVVTIGAADMYVIALDPSTPVWMTD